MEVGYNVCARSVRISLLAFMALALVTAAFADKGWQQTFSVDRANLVDNGRNTYFILEPGYRLRLENRKDSLTITVLNDTRVVDGVTCRVVEERETSSGQLAEVSRNYFAIDLTNKDVYYFGEEVDRYKDGEAVGHEGAWLSGENGAKFGLMMPGKPRVKDKYYQEYAPGVALDRAEIVSTTERFIVPAGIFKNCLRTRESSGLELGREYKLYAPNVGLIKDGSFTLVKVEKAVL